ncbi:MAG: hypothetical protein UX68_C0042G0010 [Parcubacteria group bacterium GW2011_GWA2_46_9]|nr:MAG: hypothetical protein UX68_C0042G0010 [Parcubacteria group bacterium GW2011_GWA2_46_9]
MGIVHWYALCASTVVCKQGDISVAAVVALMALFTLPATVGLLSNMSWRRG